MSADRCGYAITDDDGEMQPCDRPVTGWRWYQDVGEHEDILDVACEWHQNEGGRLIHTLTAERDRARGVGVALEQRLARVEALRDLWLEDDCGGESGCIACCGRALRIALDADQ